MTVPSEHVLTDVAYIEGTDIIVIDDPEPAVVTIASLGPSGPPGPVGPAGPAGPIGPQGNPADLTALIQTVADLTARVAALEARP